MSELIFISDNKSEFLELGSEVPSRFNISYLPLTMPYTGGKGIVVIDYKKPFIEKHKFIEYLSSLSGIKTIVLCSIEEISSFYPYVNKGMAELFLRPVDKNEFITRIDKLSLKNENCNCDTRQIIQGPTTNEDVNYTLICEEFFHNILRVVSSRIKNPFTSVKNIVELGSDRFEETDFRRKFQTIFDEEVAKIDDLVKLLNEFSGLNDHRHVKIEQDEVVKMLELVLRSEAGRIRSKNLKIKKISSDENKISFYIDKNQFEFCLRNIADTIIVNVKSGSEIRIHTVYNPKTQCYNFVFSYYLSSGTILGGLSELRMLLTKYIAAKNNGKVEIFETEHKNSISLSFSAASKAVKVKTGNRAALLSILLNSSDRRRRVLPIGFPNRRKGERRKTACLVLHRDRRN